MRICRIIATGKIIEMQSHAAPGTLIANAVSAGFAANAVEESAVTQAEYESLLAASVPLADVIAAKQREINAACEAEIAAIRAGYPDSEVLSWPKQEQEARAFTANANAATPLLDALATARGITKAELAARIIVKADLFAGISGGIIGKRQALEDALNALPANATTADVAAIQW